MLLFLYELIVALVGSIVGKAVSKYSNFKNKKNNEGNVVAIITNSIYFFILCHH